MTDVDPQALLDRWRAAPVTKVDVGTARRLAAALIEARRERDEAEEMAGSDVLTAWRVRNAALAVAASFVHPGPDWEDEQARKRLVVEWVGDGHDQVAEENRQRLLAIQRMIAAEAERDAARTEAERLEGIATEAIRLLGFANVYLTEAAACPSAVIDGVRAFLAANAYEDGRAALSPPAHAFGQPRNAEDDAELERSMGAIADAERAALSPPAPTQRRHEACGDDCTVDCGHCKGEGPPSPPEAPK